MRNLKCVPKVDRSVQALTFTPHYGIRGLRKGGVPAKFAIDVKTA